MSVWGRRIRPTRGTLLSAGAVFGFMGTTASIGGPAIALVYQEAPGHTVRGTLAAYFVAGVSFTLVALAVAGRFGGREMKAGLLLVPPLVVGFAASRLVARVIDRGHTRAAVLGMATVSALFVLVRYLVFA